MQAQQTQIPENAVILTARPEPFAVRKIQAHVPFGMSVAEMAYYNIPHPSLLQAHIFINGDEVPREMWMSVRPKPGAIVTINVVPGKGGKNPLATVLSLALMVAAPGLGAALGTALGSSLGFLQGGILWNVTLGSLSLGWSTIGAGIVSVVGKLAINAIAPPPKQRNPSGARGSAADKPTQFISGTQNQFLRFAAIPRVLGRMRMVPPYASVPFTETVGGDQYVRALYCLGYGPLSISDFKIGETALSEFEGVEIEVRQGYDDDDPVTIITNQTRQNDLQVTLTNAAGYQTRTTEEETDEISVDITLPRGLVQFNSSGGKNARTIQVAVQYAPTGTSDWSNAVDSYTAYASRTSPVMERPDAQWIPGGGQGETRIIYRVYMNPANGELGVVKGARSRVTDTVAADEPIIPSGMLKIARVERRTNDDVDVPANRISDERDLSKVGDYFEASTDFLPGTTGTDNCISVAAGGLSHPGLKITAKQTSAIRKEVRFKVTRGQYDVRLKRLTADTASDQIFDEVQWTALRSIKNAPPVNLTGMALVALRIKASDQLNGSIGQFNCVVESILPDWNGSTWVEQETSNPAAIYREVLQGSANARALADGRIDLDALAEWHEDCADDGYEFNYIVDQQQSVHDLLADVAAAGRASPAIVDGMWRVVQDKPQATPVQHFTPRNSFGFQGEKTYPELPHAFRVRFINRDKGWQQDERMVYDDGYSASNATRFETLDLSTGITSSDQAWKHGRYHIATARLRPETYVFNTDIEHIVCTRGDLVRVTHDVMLTGLGSGRIKSIISSGSPSYITGFTFDETFTMEGGVNYAIQIRTAGNSFLTLGVATEPGQTKTLTLSTPYLASSFDGVVGDLAAFGVSGQESLECIVKAVEPASDLTARITCLDAAPAIHTADTSTIPTHSSVITVPPELKRPPAPIVATVQTDEEVLIRNPDGSIISTIVITFSSPDYPLPLNIGARIKTTEESDYSTAKIISDRNKVTIIDVEAGEYYDIILFYKNQNGISSPETTRFGEYVIGVTGLPSDVGNFSVTIQDTQASLAWDAVTDIDLSHYKIKWSDVTSGATWESSIDLVAKVSTPMTSKTVPALSGTYLIKAVDFGGRESANAVTVVSTVAEVAGYNAVETVTEDPAFSGTKTDVVVLDSALRLSGADLVSEWLLVSEVPLISAGEDGVVSSGTYDFAGAVDLSDVYTSRIAAAVTVAGINIYDIVSTWDSVLSRTSIANAVDPSLYTVRLQIRKTNDDPGGAPVWSDWMDFVVGDYTGRAFEFRCLLSSSDTGVTPVVSELAVTIDMPDRDEEQNGLSSVALGSTVSYLNGFKAVPGLGITAHNMGTGDYFAITSKTATGFDIRFFNAAGTGVVRTFDYHARGYGKNI